MKHPFLALLTLLVGLTLFSGAASAQNETLFNVDGEIVDVDNVFSTWVTDRGVGYQTVRPGEAVPIPPWATTAGRIEGQENFKRVVSVETEVYIVEGEGSTISAITTGTTDGTITISESSLLITSTPERDDQGFEGEVRLVSWTLGTEPGRYRLATRVLGKDNPSPDIEPDINLVAWVLAEGVIGGDESTPIMIELSDGSAMNQRVALEQELVGGELVDGELVGGELVVKAPYATNVPSVIAYLDDGSRTPVQGIDIVFNVVGENSTITGVDTNVTLSKTSNTSLVLRTNEYGVASLESWLLGTELTTYQVDATVESSFNATGNSQVIFGAEVVESLDTGPSDPDRDARKTLTTDTAIQGIGAIQNNIMRHLEHLRRRQAD